MDKITTKTCDCTDCDGPRQTGTCNYDIIIDKSSNAFRKLVSTGKFDTRFFPSSSIIIIDDKNEVNDIFEFVGYQSADNIIEILNDKEIMEIYDN